MSTEPTTPDTDRLPGDPEAVAPNGGAPTVVAEVIARRDAERAAPAAVERRASRY